MKIIIGTILVLFSLNTILIKYGHITIKRTGRIIMDKAYFITQTLLLWLEHIAMIFSGLVFGLWIAKRRAKKNEISQSILTKEEVRSIVKAENSYWEVAEAKEITKEKPKESICPEWGKEFVSAIGQVWLEKNFGKSNIIGRT